MAPEFTDQAHAEMLDRQRQAQGDDMTDTETDESGEMRRVQLTRGIALTPKGRREADPDRYRGDCARAKAARAAGASPPTAGLPCRTATVEGTLLTMRDLNRAALHLAAGPGEIRVLIDLGNALSRAIDAHRALAAAAADAPRPQ